jgi:NNP family nitrate/nitrite transporter-like MFS transporter
MIVRDSGSEAATPAAAAAAGESAVRSAAVLGLSSALAAFGAFFVPMAFGAAIANTGGPKPALYALVACYLSCLALTWWYYARQGAEVPC